MAIKIILLSIFVIFSTPLNGVADSELISQLSEQIAKAQSGPEKSKLHIYRARNYKNMGNIEMAENDYDAALKYDQKGWIHLERGRFFIACGNFVQAKKEALAAEKQTPTLKGESQKIVAIADKNIKKEKVESEEYTPKEILLTKRWKATYSTSPSKGTSKKSNVRLSYAKKNKKRAKSRPRPVARS